MNSIAGNLGPSAGGTAGGSGGAAEGAAEAVRDRGKHRGQGGAHLGHSVSFAGAGAGGRAPSPGADEVEREGPSLGSPFEQLAFRQLAGLPFCVW